MQAFGPGTDHHGHAAFALLSGSSRHGAPRRNTATRPLRIRGLHHGGQLIANMHDDIRPDMGPMSAIARRSLGDRRWRIDRAGGRMGLGHRQRAARRVGGWVLVTR